MRALLASSHDVAAVVTRPDAPAGRGRRLVQSPVAELAAEHGLEVLKPGRPSEPEFLGWLREIAPDCCPVVAYGGLLRPAALEIPPQGWVNLHFSILPAWRGAAPVQHALLAGDAITGASTFRLVEELDAGPVFGVLTERIRPDDTAGTLLERLSLHGADLLVQTIDGIATGELEAREQSSEGVSLAPKITVDDARIDWTQPATAVDRRVRACTPEPGAWTTFRGERFKIGVVREIADSNLLTPGAIAAGKREVLVGTGTHPVQLGEVQPPGKPRMDASAWARGVRISDGECFGVEP